MAAPICADARRSIGVNVLESFGFSLCLPAGEGRSCAAGKKTRRLHFRRDSDRRDGAE
jgi:hypothetical protein